MRVVKPLILEFTPKIKIIAQTAYASTDEKSNALKVGCADYISKPTKGDELIRIVQKNLL